MSTPQALVDNDESLVESLEPKKKVYTYSKEKKSEYSKKAYRKNREAIIAKNKALIMERYHNDPEYRKKKLEAGLAHRAKQKALIMFAKQIIKENEAREEARIKNILDGA